MKKTKKVLIALILAVVMIFGVAGCNEDRVAHKYYSVVYEGVSYDWSVDRKNFVGISSSYNELIELCAENNCGFYDEKNQDYESDFGKKVREYTEEFFESKSLVVCTFTQSSYSGPHKVLSLEVIDDTLTVKIKRPFTGTADNVVVCWGFIIEVDKSIVSDVTSSKYVVISI